MIDRQIILSGGFKCLLGEALPSISSAASIFANAPAGTVLARITIRTAGMTATFDGTTTPTAGANGQDFDTGSYDIYQNQVELKKISAIQNGGTCTGWITYFGVNT